MTQLNRNRVLEQSNMREDNTYTYIHLKRLVLIGLLETLKVMRFCSSEP